MHQGAGEWVGDQSQAREEEVFGRWRWGGGRVVEGRWGWLEAWGCPALPRAPHSSAPGSPALASLLSLPPIRCLGVAKANTPLLAGSRIWGNDRSPAALRSVVPEAARPEVTEALPAWWCPCDFPRGQHPVWEWRPSLELVGALVLQDTLLPGYRRAVGCCRVPLPQYLWSHWGVSCFVPPPCFALRAPYAFSSAGNERDRQQEKYSAPSDFFPNANFLFFWVEVGHSRGDRVRASTPGYCIPLPW